MVKTMHIWTYIPIQKKKKKSYMDIDKKSNFYRMKVFNSYFSYFLTDAEFNPGKKVEVPSRLIDLFYHSFSIHTHTCAHIY